MSSFFSQRLKTAIANFAYDFLMFYKFLLHLWIQHASNHVLKNWYNGRVTLGPSRAIDHIVLFEIISFIDNFFYKKSIKKFYPNLNDILELLKNNQTLFYIFSNAPHASLNTFANAL